MRVLFFVSYDRFFFFFCAIALNECQVLAGRRSTEAPGDKYFTEKVTVVGEKGKIYMRLEAVGVSKVVKGMAGICLTFRNFRT